MSKQSSTELVPGVRLDAAEEPSLEEAIQAQEGLRVVDFREQDGIAVALVLHESENRLFVSVRDSKAGHIFELPAQKDKAWDIFNHPYGYVGAGSLAVSQAYNQEAA
ncbi:MAG TPA: hypothetical protein VLE51_03460 [Candidatus Saccharimonadales bacterium]|nr:hypothetical protein [Candidatus Saccharimonadales bacterium]